MTWPELLGWLDEMARQKGHGRSNTDSWAGAEGDEFWQAAAKRRRERMTR